MNITKRGFLSRIMAATLMPPPKPVHRNYRCPLHPDQVPGLLGFVSDNTDPEMGILNDDHNDMVSRSAYRPTMWLFCCTTCGMLFVANKDMAKWKEDRKLEPK